MGDPRQEEVSARQARRGNGRLASVWSGWSRRWRRCRRCRWRRGRKPPARAAGERNRPASAVHEAVRGAVARPVTTSRSRPTPRILIVGVSVTQSVNDEGNCPRRWTNDPTWDGFPGRWWPMRGSPRGRRFWRWPSGRSTSWAERWKRASGVCPDRASTRHFVPGLSSTRRRVILPLPGGKRTAAPRHPTDACGCPAARLSGEDRGLSRLCFSPVVLAGTGPRGSRTRKCSRG